MNFPGYPGAVAEDWRTELPKICQVCNAENCSLSEHPAGFFNVCGRV